MPTYNFANVVDDHLMDITHVVRGNEYITSTPKYNILYEAFNWPVPKYIHLPQVLNESGAGFSKRHGDASFQDMLDKGFLAEAVVNYIAFLGWSPPNNEEILTLNQLEQSFSIDRINKAPSKFDETKLEWLNGEHIKRLPPETFLKLAEPYIKQTVTRPDIDIQYLASLVQPRVTFIRQAEEMLGFIDALPAYETALYDHKKMKSDTQSSLQALQLILPLLTNTEPADWHNDRLYSLFTATAEQNGLKNGQILWPVRTALSGKPATPCGASELAALLGKDETIKRLNIGIGMLT
jgi:glutamyl-tRNA synthetase